MMQKYATKPIYILHGNKIVMTTEQKAIQSRCKWHAFFVQSVKLGAACPATVIMGTAAQ